jgi:hypothetical protein
MKNTFWNADKIVSLSAILISLATMGIYLYQTHLIKKQQFASVMPYLMTSLSAYNNNHFLVEVYNNGLGPAFVEQVNVKYEGKSYQDCDLPTFFGRYNKKDTINNMTWSNIISGQLIPSGNVIKTVEINNNRKEAQKLQKYFWTDKPVELEITYSSIYGEKWIVKGSFAKPQKLDD